MSPIPGAIAVVIALTTAFCFIAMVRDWWRKRRADLNEAHLYIGGEL